MSHIQLFSDKFTQEECDELIDLFEKDPRKIEGVTNDGLNHKHKKSTDLPLVFSPDENQYSKIIIPKLFSAISAYKKGFPFLNEQEWDVCPFYNIQKYEEGEGYFKLHCEHESSAPYRMLAWMIYLNNNPCGTEFPEQDLVLKSFRGDIVVWPAFWTHPHKGVTPNIGIKYIVTGWCEYIDKSNIIDYNTSK
tara:strand:+ start:26 stop:601 length:576 start_codon:yes stop_codon:yes gene_type:complete